MKNLCQSCLTKKILTQSLTLIDNPFDQLLDCEAPPKEMIHRANGCRQFSRDSIIPIMSVNLDIWVMLKSFEVLLSKHYFNIWSETTAALWEKIPLIPISNGPIVIYSPFNDNSNLEKRIEGLLEEVNQPIEIVLEKVRKETFQLLIPNSHSYN